MKTIYTIPSRKQKRTNYPTHFRSQLLLLLLSHFSRVRNCETPWTAAYQAPLSMGFSRQEYWSGVPLPSPLEASNTRKSKEGQKRKLQTNISHKLQCKNCPQNTSKPNTTMYKKNYTAQPNGIYFSCARLVNIQQSIPKNQSMQSTTLTG